MKFSDIIGNEAAKNHLRRLIDGDCMPHALLIHGPTGTAKLQIARVAAQYIHCTNRSNGEPCGQCPSCRQHQSFNHVDTFFSFPIVKKKGYATSDDYFTEWCQFLSKNPIESYLNWLHEINAENSQPIIYVDESQSIIRKMSLASYSAKYKVLIMWLPEKMKEDCANKLLKMIEEPSSDSLFILVSESPKDIIPTILSRTQQLELRKLSTQEVADYLQQRWQLSSQDALAVAAPADGNPLLAEQNLSHDGEIKDFFDRFTKLMRCAYSRDLKSLKKWADEAAGLKREKSRRLMTYIARMIRENYIRNLGRPTLNYFNTSEEQFSQRFAPFINESNVERMIAEVEQANTDIAGNANAKIVLFDFAVKMTILIKR